MRVWRSPVLETWRQALTVDFLRYFLAAAPFYAVFWLWRPPWAGNRRIQPGDPAREQVASEIATSLATILIFSAIGATLVFAQRGGHTRIYLDASARGWAYAAGSVVAATLLHDAYFYWTHRLLHWRPLFRLVHHVHHRSTSPTPWAAYAFHPVEALVQAGAYVVIVFTIPMHPLALFVFLVYMIVRNVVGHLGFEVWPSGFAAHPWTRWHLTPTHHDLHHRFGKGNYGLYFSFWDTLMKTGQPDYAAAFESVASRGRGSSCRVTPTARATLGLVAFGVLVLGGAAQAADAGPDGRWVTVDDHTGTPRSVVRVWIEDGELGGRVEEILAMGADADPDPVCGRCRGPRHGQRVVGMEILSGFRHKGKRWEGGRVLDPESGKEYSSAVWLDAPDRLRVRGYWGPFFRTQSWKRAGPAGAEAQGSEKPPEGRP